MSDQVLKERILDVVRSEGDATFARLEQLEGFGGGDQVLGNTDTNVIVWGHLTTEAVTAVMELQREGRISVKVVSPFFYFHDGSAGPNLPIAKKPPAQGYKEPHWQPVLLVPGNRKGGQV